MIETYIKGNVALSDTIVFLHDGIGCCKSMQAFVDLVHEKTNRPCFMYSRHGHGSSAPGRKFNLAAQVEFLYNLIASYNIFNPTIFAHSCGTTIGLEYAARHPVSKLVVTAPYIRYDDQIVKTVETFEHKFDAGGMPYLSSIHNDADKMFYTWFEYIHSDEFKALDLRESIKQIECPVVAIKYSNDFYMSEFHTKEMATLIPNFLLIELVGSKHSVHKRNADTIIKLL